MNRRLFFSLLAVIIMLLVVVQTVVAPGISVANSSFAYRLGHSLGKDIWYVGLATALIRLAVMGRRLFSSEE